MADKPKKDEKEQNKQEKEQEKKQEKEEKVDKKKEEKKEDKKEKPKNKEEKPSEKTKEKNKKENAKKPEKKDKQKSEKKDDDFQYIVRLSNTDVDGEKSFIYGLTSIKGIGLNIATLIAEETGIDRNAKVGKLSEKQIEKIQNTIDNIKNLAPDWMLNHRKDMETGENIHLTGPSIDMSLREEINTMRKIRSYKGIRHERGLRARGQRTKGNNRKGLTLGVSKRSVQNKNK